jgi:hypothetical protein
MQRRVNIDDPVELVKSEASSPASVVHDISEPTESDMLIEPAHTTPAPLSSCSANFLTYLPVFVDAVFCTALSYISFPRKLNWFSWHPPLLIWGALFFMPLAIWFVMRPGPRRIWNHLIAQVCAAACMLLGVAAVALNKELLGKKHLKTTHAQVGAVFFLIYCLQLVASVYLLWPSKSSREREPWRVIHTLSGLVTIILCLLSLWYGWFSHNIQASIAKLGGLKWGAEPSNMLAVGGTIFMVAVYSLCWIKRRV